MPVLSIKEAAKYLGVSVWSVRHFVWSAKLKCIQYGESTSPMKFLQSDLDTFIQQHRS